MNQRDVSEVVDREAEEIQNEQTSQILSLKAIASQEFSSYLSRIDGFKTNEEAGKVIEELLSKKRKIAAKTVIFEKTYSFDSLKCILEDKNRNDEEQCNVMCEQLKVFIDYAKQLLDFEKESIKMWLKFHGYYFGSWKEITKNFSKIKYMHQLHCIKSFSQDMTDKYNTLMISLPLIDVPRPTDFKERVHKLLSLLLAVIENAKSDQRDDIRQKRFSESIIYHIETIKDLEKSFGKVLLNVITIQHVCSCLNEVLNKALEFLMEKEHVNPLPYATAQQLYELNNVTAFENLEKEDADCCCLCLTKREEKQWLIRLKCGHSFHKQCFEEQTRNKLIRCALCRQLY